MGSPDNNTAMTLPALSSETPYTRSTTVHQNDDDGVLGVRVYGQFGTLLNKEAAWYPWFMEGHPVHFPPSIDIFLWGSLSTSIQDAVLALSKKQGCMGAFLGVFLYVLVFVSFASGTVTTFWNDHTYATFLVMLLCIVVLYFLLILQATASCFLGGLHKEMQQIVQSYQQRFAKAGYEIEYCVETGYGSFAMLSYIRMTPTSSNARLAAVAADKGEIGHPVKFTSPTTSPLPIRLLTFNPNDNNSLCCGNGYEGYRYHSTYLRRGMGFPANLRPVLNRSVFGALSEAVRPVIQKHRALGGSLFVAYYFLAHVVARVVVLLTGWSEDVYSAACLGIMVGILVFHRPIMIWRARDLHPDCRAAVMAIAPQIEERSDYLVRFVQQPGDGGDTTTSWLSSLWFAESYIELVPRSASAASATTNIHDEGLV